MLLRRTTCQSRSETRPAPAQVLIHITFIVSALGIAYVDKLSESGMRKRAE
jgi:uncharacterized membrane protein YqhA